MVHLRTLGRIDLRGNSGEPIPAVTSRPRELALLTYLAAAGPGAFRRRDTILAMFWAETPEERARHTLSQMLYRLRRVLGDDVLVSRGQEEIGVSEELFWCDVVEFRSALEEARWDDAVALYLGPFLPGFFVSGAVGLERWMEEERQDHRRAARDAAVALSERLEQEGDLRGAVNWAKRAWEIEPASDNLLRRPLRLLQLLGERSEAVVLFEDFRRRMADDYGLEPSAQTLDLMASIRAQDTRRPEAEGAANPPSTLSGRETVPAKARQANDTRERHGPGLGGTLAGAGAALVGAAALFWVFLSPGGPAAVPPVRQNAAPVVVVLPVAVSGPVSPEFGNLTGALTDELVARLGEVSDFMVVAPEAVEPLLQEVTDAVEIGRRLQGDAVVESSLDWQPSGVEASARVTDVSTGETVWGTSHRYPHSELLGAQMDLTVGLASALNVRLGSVPQREITFSSDEELLAWALVSQAEDSIIGGAMTAEREEGVRRLIQRALDLRPDYAPAYAELSRLYNRIQLRDSAMVAAERALSLDPDHYTSQLAVARAMISAAVWNFEEYPPPVLRRGVEAALRALQLNPSSFEAALLLSEFMEAVGRAGRDFLWSERSYLLRRNGRWIQNNRGHKLWLLGEYDAAIQAYQRVAELDPTALVASYRPPEVNLSRGRLEEAREQIEAARVRDPEMIAAYPVAVYLDLMEGRYEAAEALIEELLDRDPSVEVITTSNFFPHTALGYVYLKTGRIREGRRLLELARDARLNRVNTVGGITAHYDLARIYAMLGDQEQAVHWIQVAIDRGWPFYYTEMGRTDPMLENVRGNQDFERIMNELKAELDAERAWVDEMLALPEPERFRQMLMDAEEQLEAFWEAQGAG